MSKKVIQIPIDIELLEALDSLSMKEGRARAEVIRNACRRYLRQLEEEELDQVYREGYARVPEEPALGEVQASLASRLLGEERW